MTAGAQGGSKRSDSNGVHTVGVRLGRYKAKGKKKKKSVLFFFLFFKNSSLTCWLSKCISPLQSGKKRAWDALSPEPFLPPRLYH